MSEKIQQYIDANIEQFKSELFDLLRIPSVSTDSKRKDDVNRAADYLRDRFVDAGLENVTIFETPGHPIVYGDWLHAGSDKPTVLFYGHYDVQPPDPLDLWTNDPFEPTVIDGKVYARGSADDKGQAYIHVKSISSFLKTGTPIPVNVKIIIEGEEEIGSPNLVPFLTEKKDLLSCDMVTISDTSMFAEDVPSITYGLRGLAYMEVEVFGPNRDLHSGVYGGAVANPLNVLCEMVAKLKDEDGVIQIPGFYGKVKPLTDEEREAYKALPFDEDAYATELGVPRTYGETGYSSLERATGRPTLDVNGIWGGYQGEGAKTVLPSKAGAKISMRLVPDQDPEEISRLFADHFKRIAPDTVRVEVHAHHGGHPAITDLNFYGMRAAAQAFEDIYGKTPLFTREGGSIPIVAAFKNILGVSSILMGFGLNSDNIHSPNEKFSLKDFHRGIKTSARFLEVLADHS
jgi:acetylornithine deacetylase/succinyl-diaminopimelate desuccinylase-like protein